MAVVETNPGQVTKQKSPGRTGAFLFGDLLKTAYPGAVILLAIHAVVGERYGSGTGIQATVSSVRCQRLSEGDGGQVSTHRDQ
jgi:hypothetical protein